MGQKGARHRFTRESLTFPRVARRPGGRFAMRIGTGWVMILAIWLFTDPGLRAGEGSPGAVDLMGSSCEHEISKQPNSHFLAFVFCDSALGSNLGAFFPTAALVIGSLVVAFWFPYSNDSLSDHFVPLLMRKPQDDNHLVWKTTTGNPCRLYNSGHPRVSTAAGSGPARVPGEGLICSGIAECLSGFLLFSRRYP